MSPHSLTVTVCALGALLVAVVHWYAVARDRRTLLLATKPAVMVLLIALAVVLGAWDEPVGRWLLAGLAFGLVGDVLLLGESDAAFLGGVAAFLLGHLAYVACFRQDWLTPAGWWWLALPLLAACAWATRDIWTGAGHEGGLVLVLAVALYAVVSGVLLVVAFRTGHWPVALGATLFVASDALLARDRFVAARPGSDVAVMVTYHLAQALLVVGALAVWDSRIRLV